MAIYHLVIRIIGRSQGRSAIACAAYRSGTRLLDQETGKIHDFTKKGGVVHSEINLPIHAPEVYQDRQALWNEISKIENKKDSQLAREVEVALPRELSREQQIDLVRSYVDSQFVSKGMCADWAVHDKGDGNPHAHIMLTMRGIRQDGKWAAKERKAYKLDADGNKIPVIDPVTGEQKVGARGRKLWKRETVQANNWNDKSKAEEWRKAWADACNERLSVIGAETIDHRSYQRQGLEIEPTVHEGHIARQLEAQGRISDRCEQNREIRKRNAIRLELMTIAKEIKNTLMKKAGDLIGKLSGRSNGTTIESDDYNKRAAATDCGATGSDHSLALVREARAVNCAARATEHYAAAKRRNQEAERRDRDAERERHHNQTESRIEEGKSKAGSAKHGYKTKDAEIDFSH